MANDDLGHALSAAGAAGELSEGALRELWASLPLVDSNVDYLSFEDAFLVQLRGDDAERLAFRPGGWVVSASSPLIKTALTTAVLAVGLVSAGAIGIPLLVIPTVLPMLIDIERVQLTASEEHLAATLVLTEDAVNGTAEELYARLPDHLQEQVTELAFRDFLDKCLRAGVADPGDEGETFLVRGPSDARFRVRFT